jgi:hypothetical protein
MIEIEILSTIRAMKKCSKDDNLKTVLKPKLKIQYRSCLVKIFAGKTPMCSTLEGSSLAPELTTSKTCQGP